MTCSPDRGNKDQQTSRKIMDRLQHTFPGIYTFCQLQTELYQLNLCEESLQLCHIAQCSIFSLVLTPHDQQVSTFPNKKRSCQAPINPQLSVLEQPAETKPFTRQAMAAVANYHTCGGLPCKSPLQATGQPCF